MRSCTLDVQKVVTLLIIHIGCHVPSIHGETPLLLTPFLESGNAETARRLSQVPDDADLFSDRARSYAAFLTVDKHLGNHMFFWFFDSVENEKAPLMLWLNGGPSVSSMFGLFWEHGPLRVVEASSPDEPASYARRQVTWVGPFSMLYVDNPIGAGYSFSDQGEDGYRYSQEAYSQDLLTFLEQFFQLFPKYSRREFYIGGQSYAGKYVTSLSHLIHTRGREGTSNISFTGVYMGGPFFDPPTEVMAITDYLYALGAVSLATMHERKEYVTSVLRRHELGELSENTGILMSNFYQGFGEDNFMSQESPQYYQVAEVMNSTELRRMLHVGDELSYHVTNHILYGKFCSDLLLSTKLQLAEILDSGYKVLVFTGDFDSLVSSVMVEESLLSTPWTRQGEYNSSSRSMWLSGQGQLVGFVSHVGPLCRVVVHRAGHQTPYDQPDTSLRMMEDFVSHGCVQRT